MTFPAHAISKTTLTFAKARGLELNVEDMLLEVYRESNDAEPMFSLRMQQGHFYWDGNTSLPQSIKEELPAHYPDEKALRLMLDFVSQQLAG